MSHESADVLLIRLADRWLALPVSSVREVLHAVALSPPPTRDDPREGILNLRGRSVPVVDLASPLGFERSPIATSHHLVVLEEGGESFAVRSEGPAELRTVTLLPPDATEAPASTPLIGPAVRWDERIVSTLNVTGLRDRLRCAAGGCRCGGRARPVTANAERIEPGSELDAVLRIVSARTGLVFPEERRRHAGDVALRLMRARGLDDVAAYGRLLARNAVAFDELTAELTIGETFFFRDATQFAILRERFAPALLRERPADHEFRAWSAGCASGEEAWSLAILFEELGFGGRSRVVGTDISRTALERARAGRYRPWSLRGEAAARAGDWVREEGELYVVAPRLRPRVAFEYLNLADETYPEHLGDFDLVLCRNVLIYFDATTIRHVAGRLFESLAPGGWLVTGASDPPIGAFAPFERLETEDGVVFVRPRTGELPRADGRIVAREHETSRRVEVADACNARELSLPSKLRPRSSPPARQPGEQPVLRTTAPQPERTDAAVVPVDPKPETATDGSRDVAERVRRAANDDVAEALRLAGEATRRYELDVELHYLHAVLLAEEGRLDEAAEAARRALFLDRTLVVGHVLLGTVRRRQGDFVAARRAFVNARRRCGELPDDAVVALADGAVAEGMRASIERHLALLETAEAAREARR